MQRAGKDATQHFFNVGHSDAAKDMREKYHVGYCMSNSVLDWSGSSTKLNFFDPHPDSEKKKIRDDNLPITTQITPKGT